MLIFLEDFRKQRRFIDPILLDAGDLDADVVQRDIYDWLDEHLKL
jgi:esterase/lipase superfamily enzyme